MQLLLIIKTYRPSILGRVKDLAGLESHLPLSLNPVSLSLQLHPHLLLLVRYSDDHPSDKINVMIDITDN